ncbi:hypothetical protein GFS31_04660 [Leptolyngbya sp. BL0902]|uniref:hypothetical protein n=1 Tax=Leptolyngbya sp. BL0902 TaxID=1115757 RepID=UPI0018E6E1F7|nr:hypothetical protein [Leptolyngbya sp. BL0902]QQE63796.1 hypothetical protein GFS31_04660 [Leptolyngbya sp. BL0902]
MTLALGTSLQHGTYVIDALSGEDSIGPLYLATHVPSGQWVLVRVLGSRHPESLPDASQRRAFYQYLESLTALGTAFVPKKLAGFEEDKVCYQVFAAPPGSPLSEGVAQTPRPLAPSLALVRQVAQHLETLRSVGWAGLRIAPDQVWQGPGGSLTLTGFDFPASGQASGSSEANLVWGLTELLYFLLTGQRASQAPLGVDLRHRRPELPTGLDAVFQWANPSLAQAQPPSLAEWLALLPHPASADLSSVAPSHPQASERAKGNSSIPAAPQAQRTTVATVLAAPVAPPPTHIAPAMTAPLAAVPAPKRVPWKALALLTTGFVFGIGGVAFGLQARLQPSSPAAQTRFNPNQAFPPLPNWDGNGPEFGSPTVENRRSRSSERPGSLNERPNERPSNRPTPASEPATRSAPLAQPSDDLNRDPSPAGQTASPPRRTTPSTPRPAPPVENEAPTFSGDDSTPSFPSSPDPAPPIREVAPAPVAPPVEMAPAPVAPPPTAPAPVAPPPPVPAPVAPPPPLVPAPESPAPLTSS